jgi:hypothetical protein
MLPFRTYHLDSKTKNADAAILENVEWDSPPWQPHLLAASVHDFHGEQSPDSPVVKQARQALESKG